MTRWPADYVPPSEKACTRCKVVKPLVEGFYQDRQKRDGRCSVCRECSVKEKSAKYYEDPSKFSRYRREYSQRPERIAARVESEKRQRAASPEKFKARIAVNNAIARGKMERLPCRDCGDPNSHAHHHDYSKPLDVVFLCRACHAAEHRRERGTPMEAGR